VQGVDGRRERLHFRFHRLAAAYVSIRIELIVRIFFARPAV